MKSIRPFPVALVAALGVTLLVYWPGLNGPLVLDDVANLDVLRRLDSQNALSLTNILAEKGAALDARPVSFLSFLLNWHLAGDDVWALKLTNVLLHAFNGVLVYFLAHALLRLSARLSQDALPWCAALAAAFWLLTPVQVSTVLYVIQRMAALSCCFTLLGMLAWCHGRLLQSQRPRLGIALMAAAIVVCWPLASLSKQNGVLLVLLLLITEWLIIAPRGERSPWPGRLLALLCVTFLLLAAARYWLDPGWILDGYLLRDFTLAERLLTQPRALLHQLLNVLQLPGGTALGLFHDDFAVSRTLVDPPTTLASLAFWLAVPIAAWRFRSTTAGLPLFGVAFFLAAHSLEAGPFALEIYFEHRSYLPSVGIAVAVAAMAGIAVNHVPRTWPVAVLAGLLLGGHATFTAARTIDWTSWKSIVEANARRHPGSVRAQTGLAVLAFQSGRLQEGLGALDRVRSEAGRGLRPALALHTLTGYCLSGVPPPQDVMHTTGDLETLDDAPYAVAALRWYREVITATSCPGQRPHDVALLLSRRVLSRPGAGLHRGNWLLHAETARILAAAGEPSVARLHLARARRFAPASARRELGESQFRPRGG